jgi:predicted nucleic acid-binding protein
VILIDTDVLIDVALDRHPHTVASSKLLDRIENGSEDASIAWHSVSNLYYLVSPSLGGISTRDFIVELTRFVGVAPADAESIRYAAALPMDDFEDAMQVAAARACGARQIVTRNLGDYERSPIPAVGPQEALAGLF